MNSIALADLIKKCQLMEYAIKTNLATVTPELLHKLARWTTQRDLAKKLGITEVHLSYIKKGKRIIGMDTYLKLVEIEQSL